MPAMVRMHQQYNLGPYGMRVDCSSHEEAQGDVQVLCGGAICAETPWVTSKARAEGSRGVKHRR